jgi:hypothetical protein
MLVFGVGREGFGAYNWRISMSVKPAGNPVAASCLALRSYEEIARLLNFGSAGSAEAIVAKPATAPKICLIEGIVSSVMVEIDIERGDDEWRYVKND